MDDTHLGCIGLMIINYAKIIGMRLITMIAVSIMVCYHVALSSESGIDFGKWKKNNVSKVNVDRSEVLFEIESYTEGIDNRWKSSTTFPVKDIVNSGDLLLLEFSARRIDTIEENGLLYIAFGQAKPPHLNSLYTDCKIYHEWTDISLPFYSKQKIDKNEGRITIGAGGAKQKIEITNLHFKNYAKKKLLKDLKDTRSYEGIADTAKWRVDAVRRIDSLRKGDIVIKIVDKNGIGLKDMNVKIEMQKHHFNFGSAYNGLVYKFEKSHPDYFKKYHELFNEMFSIAIIEHSLTWNAFEENSVNKHYADRGIKWLKERGKKIIVYATPGLYIAKKVYPKHVYSNIVTANYNAYMQKSKAYIENMIKEYRSRVDQWVVSNEVITSKWFQENNKNKMIETWFKQAINKDSSLCFGILEHSVIEVSTKKNVEWYENAIKYLVDNKIKICRIGFQCHFREILTDPEKIILLLDRFGKFGIPLQICEFDIETKNEELQARYTNDFLIAAFSSPAVNEIIIWGFYEGMHWRPDAAMYRIDWSLKPNGAVYRDLIFNKWWTNESGSTDSTGIIEKRGYKGEYKITVSEKKVQKEFYISVCNENNSFQFVF